MWISRVRLDDAGHLRVAPDLVVEVLSPGGANERRDRDLKLSLYSRQGVREYWIIDCARRLVQVYRRLEAELHLVGTLESTDQLASPMLPGFTLSVASLWMPAVGSTG